jgi:hypothetical protein
LDTFLATLLVFGLAFAGLAAGVLLGRDPIRGSCGGLSRLGIAKQCSCDSPCPRRRRELEHLAAAAGARNER